MTVAVVAQRRVCACSPQRVTAVELLIRTVSVCVDGLLLILCPTRQAHQARPRPLCPFSYITSLPLRAGRLFASQFARSILGRRSAPSRHTLPRFDGC